MSYYIFIQNGQINGGGECQILNTDTINFPVDEDTFKKVLANQDKYMFKDSQIVENPEYEEIKRQKEEARINNLTMTALDFVNVLKTQGLTDSEIMAFLNTNPHIQLQLMCCQNVYCGIIKQYMPLEVNGKIITAEIVEKAFRIKNGEEV